MDDHPMKSLRGRLLAAAMAAACALVASPAVAADALADGFAAPPASAKSLTTPDPPLPMHRRISRPPLIACCRTA